MGAPWSWPGGGIVATPATATPTMATPATTPSPAVVFLVNYRESMKVKLDGHGYTYVSMASVHWLILHK